MNDKETIPYHRTFPLSVMDRLDILDKIDIVLQTGMLTNGEHVRKLEDAIQKIYHTDYVVCTSSCTQALLICLNVRLPIQLAAFNWWSDLYVVEDFLKRDITWNDVDIHTWLPIQEPQIQSLYLHTFGNIGVSSTPETIYDGSHSFGADFIDIGLATCISMAPTKLITSGEGGIILTNNKEFHDIVVEYRDKCSRMTEPQAIIGLQTLKYLDEVKAWKKKVYEYYKLHIPGIFQVIPYDSSYNTIGFLNVNRLKVPSHITTKQYYEPLEKGLSNTDYIYSQMVVLPSFINVNYKQIVEDILNENNL